jgi:hypothetical protein
VTCVILRDKHRFRICENEVSGKVHECRTVELTERRRLLRNNNIFLTYTTLYFLLFYVALIILKEGDFEILWDKCSEIYIFELKRDKVKSGR